MAEQNKQKRWPAVPTDDKGKPRPWVVATQAFSEAARISMYNIYPGWYFSIPAKLQDETSPCYLVASYDPYYRSFEVDRRYLTGQTEKIFSPSTAVPPPDYRKILDLMQAWQDEARKRQCPEHDVRTSKPPNTPNFDLVL